MNETILAVLRENADGDIHIETLLRAVHTGARRQRRRRQVMASAAVAVVVVAALVGVSGATAGRRPATSAGPAPQATMPRPPRVVGAPTAADSPAVLGVSPSLFHLDLTDLPGWRELSWDSRPGHEEMAVTTQSGERVEIEADRDREGLRPQLGTPRPVPVGGKLGEVAGSTSAPGSHLIRWQPVPGIWAQVDATGSVAFAIGIAEKLRLDRVHRCAVPFRLQGMASVRMTKCTTYYTNDGAGGGWTASGGVWFRNGQGSPEYQVAVGDADQPNAVNDTIDGRPVAVTLDVTPPEIRYSYAGRTVHFWAFSGAVDEEFFRSLVSAFDPVVVADQETWPSDPFTPR